MSEYKPAIHPKTLIKAARRKYEKEPPQHPIVVSGYSALLLKNFTPKLRQVITEVANEARDLTLVYEEGTYE